MRKVFYSVLALVFGLTVGGHAQQPQASSAAVPQPSVTFKTDVNFVEIHAIVTDERGNLVRDLSEKDFEVFEDGEPQTPSVFSLVDLPIDGKSPRRSSLQMVERERPVLSRTTGKRSSLIGIARASGCTAPVFSESPDRAPESSAF